VDNERQKKLSPSTPPKEAKKEYQNLQDKTPRKTRKIVFQSTRTLWEADGKEEETRTLPGQGHKTEQQQPRRQSTSQRRKREERRGREGRSSSRSRETRETKLMSSRSRPQSRSLFPHQGQVRNWTAKLSFGFSIKIWIFALAPPHARPHKVLVTCLLRVETWNWDFNRSTLNQDMKLRHQLVDTSL
jgi:hypothetical protein